MAISTTPRRRGRRPKHYTDSNGNPIPGLARRPSDGRWRVIGSDITFSEPDEKRAIARFYALTAGGRPQFMVPVSIAMSNASTAEVTTAVQIAGSAGGSPVANWLEPFPLVGAGAFDLQVSLDIDGNLVFSRPGSEAAFWNLVRQQILSRPLYVAEQTGIEQIGYLKRLVRPQPSPRLDQLLSSYIEKGMTRHEVAQSKLFWGEFVQATGAATLEQVTHDTVRIYEKKIQEMRLSPKSVRLRFTKLRTILRYEMRRAEDKTEYRQALDVLMMLQSPSGENLNPRPMTPQVFWAFYRAAVAAKDHQFAAMMLMMLNCCMYAGEVAQVKWTEVNFKTRALVSQRSKTKVTRVAVLWPETLAAIKKLPNDRELVFYSKRRSFTSDLIYKIFANYRTTLNLPDALPSDIRDAAYTVACRVSDLEKAEILAGHRLPGKSDNYLKRYPEIVQPGCDAIYKEFKVAAMTRLKVR